MIRIGTVACRALTALGLMLLAAGLSGCLGEGTAPHLKPIPAAAQARLAKLGMTQDAPILIRIFKQEAELEVWKKKDDGQFHLFKSYPICNYSGELGPKLKQGDKQAPEGFYTVSPGRMNPNSNYHLSFNLGYPNKYDAAHGRTGAHLMVHGDCSSAGCYAMTDALIEEIYAIARESFEGGQRAFHVHAFPFRMTEKNMARHRGNRWYGFWKTLKAGYEAFEQTRVQPKISVCEKRYLVNAEFYGDVVQPDPEMACPPHRKLDAQTILARLNKQDAPEAAPQSRPDDGDSASGDARVAASEPAKGDDAARETRAGDATDRSERPRLASTTGSSASSAETDDGRAEDDTGAAEAVTATGQGPWLVPEATPAAKKGDRETRSSAPADGSST